MKRKITQPPPGHGKDEIVKCGMMKRLPFLPENLPPADRIICQEISPPLRLLVFCLNLSFLCEESLCIRCIIKRPSSGQPPFPF